MRNCVKRDESEPLEADTGTLLYARPSMPNEAEFGLCRRNHESSFRPVLRALEDASSFLEQRTARLNSSSVRSLPNSTVHDITRFRRNIRAPMSQTKLPSEKAGRDMSVGKQMTLRE